MDGEKVFGGNLDVERLLAPYCPQGVAPMTVELLRRYLELLQKWNARTNLTAIRNPAEIVCRHFGESLALSSLLGEQFDLAGKTLFDLGSGAGFPGVPIAISQPELRVTLIESQAKKAVFLRELVRELRVNNCSVFANRAESLTNQADLVAMRAVDKMEKMVSVAHSLLVPRGTLAIMAGGKQKSPDLTVFASVRRVSAANNTKVLLATSGDQFKIC